MCGGTGSGKSYACLKMAYDLDTQKDGKPRFNIAKVVFTPSEYLQAVKGNLPQGSVIIWDEVGVGINSRQWYSLQNQLISYVTQTVRFKNYATFYNTPAFNYVDKQIRQLFHGYIEMDKPSASEKKSYGRFKWIEVNPVTGKLYFKFPRYYENGKKHIAKNIHFSLPPKELIDAYEEKKKEVVTGWYEKYQAELKLMEKTLLGKKGVEKIDLKKLYDKVKSEIEKFLDKKGLVSSARIMLEMGLSRPHACSLARMLNEDIEAGKVSV